MGIDGTFKIHTPQRSGDVTGDSRGEVFASRCSTDLLLRFHGVATPVHGPGDLAYQPRAADSLPVKWPDREKLNAGFASICGSLVSRCRAMVIP